MYWWGNYEVVFRKDTRKQKVKVNQKATRQDFVFCRADL
jgi:hypothetical protein